MRWFWYSVAVVATLLAVAGWLFVFGRVNRLAASVPGPPSAATEPSRSASLARPTPTPVRFQDACMDGVVWLYDPRNQHWFKPVSAAGKPLPCMMRSVREQLRADGAVYVVPQSSSR